MSETTGFWSKVRGYLKYRPASSASRGWVKAGKVLIPVAIIFVLFRIGIPPLHVIPIWGPSMQPTMQVWNLPEPWEKWSFSGWVHYDPEKKPEVGSIVYFRVPNTKLREVKRVSEINDLGLLYVLPDNTEVSGEGSDNSDLYEWLCPESVIGVVDRIGTPIRTIRWFTPEGQFKNYLETNYGHTSSVRLTDRSAVVYKDNRVCRLSPRREVLALDVWQTEDRQGIILPCSPENEGSIHGTRGALNLALIPPSKWNSAQVSIFPGGRLTTLGPAANEPLAPLDGDASSFWQGAVAGASYWKLTFDPQEVLISVHLDGDGKVEYRDLEEKWSEDQPPVVTGVRVRSEPNDNGLNQPLDLYEVTLSPR